MARVHRFLVDDTVSLKKDFWLHDEAMLWQWNKVLRFREGQEVILFDGLGTDRLYRIEKLAKTEAHLVLITELKPKIPGRHVYLFFSILKKDNTELLLQKCTEIGVSNFIPIISDRTIKKDFNFERAKKIVAEGSEQCGRSDIPHVREPVHLEKILEEYHSKIQLFVCHGGDSKNQIDLPDKVGLIIGPEGGWSTDEIALFQSQDIPTMNLGEFTLRAETAAIVASSKVL